MPFVLVPIVEGKSEVESVPVLLRRLLQDMGQYAITVAKPVLVHRTKIVQSGELEKAVELARRTREACDAILVLLDADDDPPCILGPDLLARVSGSSGGIPVSVVLAKSEFEAWFLGSMESLRGVRNISMTAVSPEKPEEMRDAKQYLKHQMTAGRTYAETDDQPALAAVFEYQAARTRCPSFDKLVRDVETMITMLAE
jgi:hypothetical protein